MKRRTFLTAPFALAVTPAVAQASVSPETSMQEIWPNVAIWYPPGREPRWMVFTDYKLNGNGFSWTHKRWKVCFATNDRVFSTELVWESQWFADGESDVDAVREALQLAYRMNVEDGIIKETNDAEPVA